MFIQIKSVFQVPQQESKDKSLAFGSGNVSMDVHTKKMGYTLGKFLARKKKGGGNPSLHILICNFAPKQNLRTMLSYLSTNLLTTFNPVIVIVFTPLSVFYVSV